MSTITLTKENFISQIPELYKLVENNKEVVIHDNDEAKTQYEIAMEDLKNGVNVTSHKDFIQYMKER